MNHLLDYLKSKLAPLSSHESRARQEFILNILLTSSIILISAGLLVYLLGEIFAPKDEASIKNSSLPISVIIMVLFFFYFLFFLSRKGLARVSAYLLLGTFFLLSAFMGYTWGVEVIAGILFYVLLIVMSGILIGTRFAFFSTGLISLTMLVIDHLQRTQVIGANRHWHIEPWTPANTFMVVVIFFIVATVSWLSNREIEKALQRARASERELKKERDLLEVTVEERTRELKAAQLEKISQLYRFAEFGRLSSGAFHDMTNLLTALTLNIERMQSQKHMKDLHAVRSYLDQATLATRRISYFIGAVRKQMAGQNTLQEFSLKDEARQVLQIISYKANKSNVNLSLVCPKDITLYGDPIKFNQVMTNLISNAIDAYPPGQEHDRNVVVTLRQEKGQIIIVVQDWGSGVPKEIQKRIFEPFFTTKDFSKGTGIGLSLARDIIEKDFRGKIQLNSSEHEGARFVICLPEHENKIHPSPGRSSQAGTTG